MWLGEDHRRTWFRGLSRKDRLRANKCLKTITSPILFPEVTRYPGKEIAKLSMHLGERIMAYKEFSKLTDLDADDVLYSFTFYGHCYGDQYIPSCLERRQYEEICI